MFTKNKRNIAIAISILVMVSMACSLFAPDANDITNDAKQTATINAAMTNASIIVYGSSTPTAINGPTQTATDGPFLSIVTDAPAQTATAIFTPTKTVTPLPNTPVYTNTPRPILPTATVVPTSSNGQSVYDDVVNLCAAGVPYVKVGAIVVPCNGNVLPRTSGTDTVTDAAYELPDLSGMSTDCPTNGEMFAAHGWDTNGVKAVKDGINVEWEGCGKWQVQAVGIGTFRLHMLEGYQYTVTRANGVVTVYYGDGSWITVWGSTVRYLPSFTSKDQSWVHDAMVLMIREFNYGYSMDPRYGTVNGNLNIPEWTQPDVEHQKCPTDVYQAAAMLGGDDYRYWTEPDWSGGAWVFLSKGKGFHHFTHPGAGYFDVWTADQGHISVYADDAEIFERLNFEEGSFHCP